MQPPSTRHSSGHRKSTHHRQSQHQVTSQGGRSVEKSSMITTAPVFLEKTPKVNPDNLQLPAPQSQALGQLSEALLQMQALVIESQNALQMVNP